MVEMKATPEQLRAIQTQDRPVFVEAGAGSGKTWVLVQRFLHLLENNPLWPLESILAITFTRKATREIRSRLRIEIEARAKKAALSSHWQARRGSLERIQVYTIHGLCARILRENSIAAGIDPRFEELDEQEAELLKEEAVRETLAELAAEESALLSLLVSLKVRDLQSEMMGLLARRGDVHRLFECLPEEPELLRRWEEGLEAMRIEVWREELRKEPRLAESLDTLASQEIIDPNDILAPSVVLGMEGARLASTGNIPEAARLWLKIHLKGGKQASWGGKELLGDLKDTLKVLREAAIKLEKSGCLKETGEIDREAARDLQTWKALWDRLDANYNRMKDERAVMDFDDLEILAGRLLGQKPPGERLEAYLKGVNQLMVDEFQDTNLAQQQIVYALADPGSGGRLFVVGDAKQSIYRFRQADVSVFNRTGQDILKITREKPVVLNTSFRSQSALVAALNNLFETILKPLGEKHQDFESRPGSLLANRASPPTLESVPAPVEIWLTPSQTEDAENMSAEQGRIVEAALLAGRFLELEKSKLPVWDKDTRVYRPFRFGDAAVLFRAGTVFPLYEEQFKAAGLPYVNLSGRGYYDRPEVRDIVSLLVSLYRPDDDINLAAALRSPFFNLNDETLYRLRWRAPDNGSLNSPTPLYQALQSPPPTDQSGSVSFAAGVYQELGEMAWRTPVWELVRRALCLTGYEAALALSDQRLPGGGRQVSNIAKFMQIAREQGGSNLSNFLRRMENLRTREVREGEGPGNTPENGAVQMMSIHAAKGLEFPVVAIADLGRGERGGFSSRYLLLDPAFGAACKQRDQFGQWQKPIGYCWAEWLDQRMEEAENRRLLYVACTRAADLLLLCGKPAFGETWLSSLLAAWGISEEGADDELVSRGDFSLRVIRPEKWPKFGEMQLAAGAPEVSSVNALPAALPALVGPLAVYSERKKIPSGIIIRTPFDREEERIDEHRPEAGRLHKSESSAAALKGIVAHRALAEWDCLSLPEAELYRRLEVYTRQETQASEPVVKDIAGKALRMLLIFRGSDFYNTVKAAVERYTETPFFLDTAEGVLSGKIDLLFKEGNGTWNLVDWKTEWVGDNHGIEQSGALFEQMRVYSRAVERFLGVIPRTWLCFLNPRVIVFPVETEANRLK